MERSEPEPYLTTRLDRSGLSRDGKQNGEVETVIVSLRSLFPTHPDSFLISVKAESAGTSKKSSTATIVASILLIILFLPS